ncbi:MAG: hypothetical protein HPY66_3199 [Firmicutes bacterium]|nr:hypothetical protein [Bacillota bacterium]
MTTNLTKGYEIRFQSLKKLMADYHTNEQAKRIIDKALKIYNSLYPDSVPYNTFMKFYIERSGVSVRQISEECNINSRTVYKHIDKVLHDLMPIVYGVDGILFE